jgi:chloramphenicol-sensitive protein RarD
MKQGIMLSVLSSVLFATLYYASTIVHPMTGSSVFAWRILLGLPMLAIIISRARGWPEVRSVAQRLRREPRLLGLSVLCAFIIGIQLWLFVWAPVYGYALDVSMGYFLLPLVMVVIGRVAYGERLTPLQRVALGFALAGVLHELWLVGSLSWVTVLVALGYPPYFMLRRYLRLGSLSTLWFDMVFISPVALIVLLSQPVPVWQEFAHYPRLFVLAPLIALISSLALAAYLSASRALPLGLFGILGYVEPVLLFMVAVVLLQEPVGTAQWFTYVPIWLAVALVAFEGLLNWLHERRRLHGA